jgi:hypothetical protein
VTIVSLVIGIVMTSSLERVTLLNVSFNDVLGIPFDIYRCYKGRSVCRLVVLLSHSSGVSVAVWAYCMAPGMY